MHQEEPSIRWETLNHEVQSMKDALKGFTLLGVRDVEISHIAAMQEEIDQKSRQALVAYWINAERGELPQGIA
jgi:hypothetical protein